MKHKEAFNEFIGLQKDYYFPKQKDCKIWERAEYVGKDRRYKLYNCMRDEDDEYDWYTFETNLRMDIINRVDHPAKAKYIKNLPSDILLAIYQWHPFKEAIIPIVYSNRPVAFDSEDAKAMYDSLEDKITIYRATSMDEYEDEEIGYSWTTDIKVAHLFKKIGGLGERIIMKATVNKSDIRAVLTDREEKEIIISGYSVCPEITNE